eukprot:TRINITY_DN12515_c0_g1_i2.p4 TRINITY_DN12515_c0_g1~~TRINITY_DN12515_c0_g1_i2.p4  ORF type:complete len:101 (-),score=13.56 TRINITY_DN12515_c0_g1_i2:31-333(-)
MQRRVQAIIFGVHISSSVNQHFGYSRASLHACPMQQSAPLRTNVTLLFLARLCQDSFNSLKVAFLPSFFELFVRHGLVQDLEQAAIDDVAVSTFENEEQD